jgi:hypothetical protein
MSPGLAKRPHRLVGPGSRLHGFGRAHHRFGISPVRSALPSDSPETAIGRGD